MRNRGSTVFGRKGVAGRRSTDEDSTAVEREPRTVVNGPGHLLYCGGAVSLEVRVRDVSENGARILTQRPLPPTERFDLAFGGRTRPCHVVWREETAVGVRFV